MMVKVMGMTMVLDRHDDDNYGNRDDYDGDDAADVHGEEVAVENGDGDDGEDNVDGDGES